MKSKGLLLLISMIVVPGISSGIWDDSYEDDSFEVNNRLIITKRQELKGIFIFGSSVVDYGNNNLNPIDSVKANYLPYGIDSTLVGPTGRFSNGDNVADQITRNLNLPIVSSFLDHQTINSSIIYGVNLGSGASGILNETGASMGVTSLYQQINNLKQEIVPKLERYFGSKSIEILPQYLFLVAAGNNDYTASYFASEPHKNWTVFTNDLISAYMSQLKTLYDLGARKFLLLSVYPVGCNPVFLQVLKMDNCIEELNSAVKMFYKQLLVTVKYKGKYGMPKAQFSVVNSAKIFLDVIEHPYAAGFTNVNGTCCELAPGGGSCMKNNKGKLCKNRDEYFFFDGVHLTSAATAVLANKAHNSLDITHVYPINIQGLSRA